jgi:hypothetical protein
MMVIMSDLENRMQKALEMVEKELVKSVLDSEMVFRFESECGSPPIPNASGCGAVSLKLIGDE